MDCHGKGDHCGFPELIFATKPSALRVVYPCTVQSRGLSVDGDQWRRSETRGPYASFMLGIARLRFVSTAEHLLSCVG